jgi:hypothetical protein
MHEACSMQHAVHPETTSQCKGITSAAQTSAAQCHCDVLPQTTSACDSLNAYCNVPDSAFVSSFWVSTLLAGTYYISVTGTGSGDAFTTGYSNYASQGQFSLRASYPEFTVNTPSPSPSPSPLPSPSPSPSPEVYTSPSPSPEVYQSPSPSPNPSPSPSPNPPPPEAPNKPMSASVVKSITKVLDKNGRGYTCSFTLKVADTSGIGLTSAAVAGTWTTPVGTTTATFTGMTGGKGTTRGQVTLSFKAPSTARGCTARLTSVTLAGYTMQTSLSALTQTLTW